MPTNPGTTSLSSWWELDEASGSRGDDHGSNTLTDGNTVTQAADGFAQFTRANSEHLYRASTVDTSGDYTFGVWVYFDSVNSGSGVFAVQDSLGNTTPNMFVQMQSTNKVRLFAGASYSSNCSVNLVTGQYYFMCVTVEAATGDAVLYIDGTSECSRIGYVSQYSDVGLYLGNSFNGYFGGRMKKALLYEGRILTTDEIDWLYNSGTPRSYADLSGGGGSPTIPRGLSRLSSVYGATPGQVVLEGI